MRKLLTDKILLFIFSNKLSPHTHFPNLKQTTIKIGLLGIITHLALILIKQKGMKFDHDFSYFILLFFFPLIFAAKRKGKKNIQIRGLHLNYNHNKKNILFWSLIIRMIKILRFGNKKTSK